MSEDQANLFEPYKQSHKNDPKPSKDATLKALKSAEGLSRRILDELEKVFPLSLSDEELAERLDVESGVSGNDVAKRRSSLKSKGIVMASRDEKFNKKGNKVTGWRLTFAPGYKVSKWNP